MINKNCKIFVAGHKGLVGSAIIRKLKTSGYKKILIAEKSTLNLINQEKVLEFLKKKNQILFLLLQLKLGASMQIINIRLNLFIVIYQYKII